MLRTPIRINQIWKHKESDFQLLICGKKKNNRWQAKVLTERTDYYNGTHTMHERTLWKKYELID
jgi:hypothetical protein